MRKILKSSGNTDSFSIANQSVQSQPKSPVTSQFSSTNKLQSSIDRSPRQLHKNKSFPARFINNSFSQILKESNFQAVGSVVQRGKSKGKDPREKFFGEYGGKTKFDNWQNVFQHYGITYKISKDTASWLEIAKAAGCTLPVKVGHGRGGTGDFQEHVDTYLKGYIEYVVRPFCKENYEMTKLKDLKKKLDVS